MTTRCNGNARHWFVVRGRVGLRSPVCIRYGCGAPNPRPLSEQEQQEYGYWRASNSDRGVS